MDFTNIKVYNGHMQSNSQVFCSKHNLLDYQPVYENSLSRHEYIGIYVNNL